MNLKKLLAGFLATAILSTSAVFAEEIMLISENPEDEAVAEMEMPVMYDKVELLGTLIVAEDELYIMDMAEIAEEKLNYDENTIFVDALGYKTSKEALKDGAQIKVIASNAVTMSIPPQSYAYVIMEANEAGGFPIYAEVSEITTDDDANTVLTSADGNYEIVFAEGTTQIEPFATRNIVTAQDIKVGSRILVSASMMTMSIPAVVPAEKIVLLPETVVVEETEDGVNVVTEEIKAMIFEQDGVQLFPLRAICEAAGLEVKWDSYLGVISVGTVPMGVNLTIGENAYTKARMAHQTLSAAPVAVNDRTFVPADFFTEILGAQVSTENGEVSIIF